MNFGEYNDVSEKTPVKTKRPYRAPMLSEYGDIREITQTTGGSHTNPDRGTPPSNKTG